MACLRSAAVTTVGAEDRREHSPLTPPFDQPVQMLVLLALVFNEP